MPDGAENGLWLLLFLISLLFLQRIFHRELQVILFLITRRLDITLVLFSILLFPGVFLHESSHYLMAKLLQVPTGQISLVPRYHKDGRLQLGFIHTASTDWLRDSLIGIAPFLTGSVFIAFVGINRLMLPVKWNLVTRSGLASIAQSLSASVSQQDFWLWFYLVVAVSSTMFPSETDRRAWLPMGIIIGVVIGLLIIGGAGPWLKTHFSIPMYRILQSVNLVLCISIIAHILLIIPIWILRHLITRIPGFRHPSRVSSGK